MPQGAYLWFQMFRKQLLKDEFGEGNKEPCFFYYYDPKIICLLLIHTDNIMTFTNNVKWLNVRMRDWPFAVTKEDKSSILGVLVERVSKYRIDFSQTFYIENLIKEYDLESTPGTFLPLRYGIKNITIAIRCLRNSTL